MLICLVFFLSSLTHTLSLFFIENSKIFCRFTFFLITTKIAIDSTSKTNWSKWWKGHDYLNFGFSTRNKFWLYLKRGISPKYFLIFKVISLKLLHTNQKVFYDSFRCIFSKNFFAFNLREFTKIFPIYKLRFHFLDGARIPRNAITFHWIPLVEFTIPLFRQTRILII